MRAALAALYAASIWHPDAIPPDEWKYRNLKRLWLPLYDLLAVTAGLFASAYGSRLLDRLMGPSAVDIVGQLFAAVALVCFAAVAFPRLWPVEMVGKIILVGMVGAYAAAILLFPTPRPMDEPPNFFIAAMLVGLLPLPFFRLNLLGEEHKERRAAADGDS